MIDPIDRHAAIEALLEIHKNRPLDSDRWVIADCRRAILALPSINGIGEPDENDAISRGEAIDALVKHERSNGHNYTLFVDIVAECEEIIRNLPPIQPKRGRWEPVSVRDGEGVYRCSACGHEFVVLGGTPEDNDAYFCPNCGADMREVET